MRADALPLPWRPPTRQPSLLLGSVLVLVAVAAAVAPVGGPSLARLALAGCLVALAVAQWLVEWRVLVVALAAWLVALALVRRLFAMLAPRVSIDPLLLVAPAVLAILVVSAIRAGALSRRSALTTAVLALGVLTLLETANLSTAPLSANLAGLLFVLVPQSAFWVGRMLPDVILRATLRVFAVLAAAAAVYGLSQTFTGFPPWDRRWIAEAGYASLHVGSAIRPFGTSASAAEYAAVLTVGMVCWLALRMASRWMTIAVVAVLGTALVLVSGRGAVVMLVVALALVTAVWRGVPVRYALILTAVAVALIPIVASRLAPHPPGPSGTSSLLQHQAEGLADPFNPEKSTLLGHLSLAGGGLASVVEHPFGIGPAAVTTASSKFGGEAGQTETDIGNVATAFGPMGVVAFVAVCCLGLALAYRVASHSRAPLALAALGIVVATGNQWLNGGMYAVTWLPWLLLGWLDRPVAAVGTEGESS